MKYEEIVEQLQSSVYGFDEELELEYGFDEQLDEDEELELEYGFDEQLDDELELEYGFDEQFDEELDEELEYGFDEQLEEDDPHPQLLSLELEYGLLEQQLLLSLEYGLLEQLLLLSSPGLHITFSHSSSFLVKPIWHATLSPPSSIAAISTWAPIDRERSDRTSTWAPIDRERSDRTSNVGLLLCIWILPIVFDQ